MNHKLFSFAGKACLCCAFALMLLLSGCEKEDPAPAPPPGSLTAAFTHNLQPNCPTPCQVCFTNTSQNATAYSWDFGNGQSSTEAAPCVTYTTRGSFTVTLTARRGTESVVSTQILNIQDDVQRYKRTFPASSYGFVSQLLHHNGYTYVLMKVDGINKMMRFNSSSESYTNFPGTVEVNDMVADPDGGILCAGTSGTSIGFTKLTSEMTLNFEKVYNQGVQSLGYSIVPKNTNDAPGYIIGGHAATNNYNEGLLVNTFKDGSLYFNDQVDYSHIIVRIFRNPDGGSNSYVTLGQWVDPGNNKTDIHISTVNENGVDYLPIHAYLGLYNTVDDRLYDAVQYGNGTSYAGVGVVDGKPTFFSIQYQNQSFSQPLVVQGFRTGLLSLKSVCALTGNQGFVVSGLELSDGAFWLYVAKIDHAGNILWQKRLDAGLSADCVMATPDGGCLVGAQALCPDFSCNYPVLYKLDSNGDYQ